ncbi:hypothetical protein FR483_n552L [Paramecium bursaria Chlorella virus FR483]|uniref:Uncharacterized protein n552L n=1 Tax=Paramecium bursaria Chlorella virus FR483 TaxID=399781 RepID=A7J7Q6_PBCVF|nr:hypothetical protein FR483_n552L [Paramecium bursaria Chlorella virus FR483]ABT15837.1 hypothetical protein FR483_n552L [Paramecium bursaria Chlorella virus FR483]
MSSSAGSRRIHKRHTCKLIGRCHTDAPAISGFKHHFFIGIKLEVIQRSLNFKTLAIQEHTNTAKDSGHIIDSANKN